LCECTPARPRPWCLKGGMLCDPGGICMCAGNATYITAPGMNEGPPGCSCIMAVGCSTGVGQLCDCPGCGAPPEGAPCPGGTWLGTSIMCCMGGTPGCGCAGSCCGGCCGGSPAAGCWESGRFPVPPLTPPSCTCEGSAAAAPVTAPAAGSAVGAAPVEAFLASSGCAPPCGGCVLFAAAGARGVGAADCCAEDSDALEAVG
jgi:hypothetical protein